MCLVRQTPSHLCVVDGSGMKRTSIIGEGGFAPFQKLMSLSQASTANLSLSNTTVYYTTEPTRNSLRPRSEYNGIEI